MRIEIERVPHSLQRYDTLGDWYYEGETLHIRVSGENDDQAFLYALHELVEAKLCLARGITQEQVDEFDFAFEEEREGGAHLEDEPGDDARAPYRNEHRFAMLVEHLMARELGIHDYGEVK